MKLINKNSNFEKYYKDLVPMIKKEDNQKYFILILSLSASIFFFIFAINPTLTTITKLKKQIVDAKFVDEKLTQKIQNLSTLSQEYETLKPDLPLIMDAVPQNPEVPTFVGQIQSLGTESSVSIFNIEIQPVNLTNTNSTNSSTFTFNITGTASYDNLQIFINNLINMQRAVSTSTIQMSRNAEDNNMDFVIKGLAYFKK